ncbi:hypothetical protein ELY21_08960 [Legionella sp. km535]|nr:hypothetical protein ELY21_08960 [Legionella sp. km535]
MMVSLIISSKLLDHNSSCTPKKIIIFFQKVMVTFCDHLSGLVRGIHDDGIKLLDPAVFAAGIRLRFI